VSGAVRALRGATTVDVDDRDHVLARVEVLLSAMFERNDLQADDLISVIFTATPDLHAVFPAEAARRFGLGHVPLLCARELDVEGAVPRCVRVLMHLTTERSPGELRHVYLENARSLRDDLPG
jgi:chorismate mutase